MRHTRHGFTLIEVLLVLIVGVILTSIAMKSLGASGSRTSVRQAKATFTALHARARAQAIETGEMTRLWIDANKDSVWIVRGGEQLETVRFAEELGVDIVTSAAQVRLCMSPRGFAETSCNSFSGDQTVTFAARGDSTSLTIRPLGQITD